MERWKCYLLLLLCVAWGLSATAQPSVKLYAFTQDIIPGTIPAGVTDETGKPVNSSKNDFPTTYYIYLSYSPQSGIVPMSVTVNGCRYAFSTEIISKTPVTKVNPNTPNAPSTTILVPKTANKTVRLLVKAKHEGSKSKAVSAEGIRVGYKWKGRLYYVASKKPVRLEPVMNQ